jgi:hypothetical protein
MHNPPTCTFVHYQLVEAAPSIISPGRAPLATENPGCSASSMFLEQFDQTIIGLALRLNKPLVFIRSPPIPLVTIFTFPFSYLFLISR